MRMRPGPLFREACRSCSVWYSPRSVLVPFCVGHCTPRLTWHPLGALTCNFQQRITFSATALTELTLSMRPPSIAPSHSFGWQVPERHRSRGHRSATSPRLRRCALRLRSRVSSRSVSYYPCPPLPPPSSARVWFEPSRGNHCIDHELIHLPAATTTA